MGSTVYGVFKHLNTNIDCCYCSKLCQSKFARVSYVRGYTAILCLGKLTFDVCWLQNHLFSRKVPIMFRWTCWDCITLSSNIHPACTDHHLFECVLLRLLCKQLHEMIVPIHMCLLTMLISNHLWGAENMLSDWPWEKSNHDKY